MGDAAQNSIWPAVPERVEHCGYWELSWREYFADAYPPHGNRPAAVYERGTNHLTADSAKQQQRFDEDEAEYRQQERQCRERFSAPFVVMPDGWEGWSWKRPFSTVADLREYLESQLGMLRKTGIGDHHPEIARWALRFALEAWRDTWRVFDALAIDNRPERGDDPHDAYAAEAKISGLIRWLRGSGNTPNHSQEPADELFTTDEITALLGIGTVKTLHNRLSECRNCGDEKRRPPKPVKIGGGCNDSYWWTAIRPWLVAEWKTLECRLPASAAEARQSLAANSGPA